MKETGVWIRTKDGRIGILLNLSPQNLYEILKCGEGAKDFVLEIRDNGRHYSDVPADQIATIFIGKLRCVY